MAERKKKKLTPEERAVIFNEQRLFVERTRAMKKEKNARRVAFRKQQAAAWKSREGSKRAA